MKNNEGKSIIGGRLNQKGLTYMTDLTKKFAQFLLLGDTVRSFKIIEKLLHEGFTSLYIYENVIKEALYYIGYLWEIDEISVADEHLATGTADYVLTKLDFHLDQNDEQVIGSQKQVMLFCIEGEEHYVGIKMAASIFKQNSWNVKYLGPNLPLQHAIYYANKSKPDVICLSVTVSHHLKNLPEYIQTLEMLDHKPTIILGSRLAEKYDLSKFISNQTLIVPNLENLTVFINGQLIGIEA